MTKLIIIVLAVVAIVWLLRRAISGQRGGASAERPEAKDARDAADGGALVSCAHCSVNLPRAEARSAGSLHYCSEEHRRLGPRKP